VVARDYNRDSYNVVAASDGRDYLLAYDCGSYVTPAICTAVVTAEGVVSKSPMVHAGTAPDLAWNGIEYLLVYRRSNFVEPPEPSLFARRLTRGGAAVGAEITLGVGGAVAVASDGTDYYVVWTFDRVQGRVVRAAGAVEEVRDVAAPVQSFGSGNLDVASNGSEYLVTWAEALRAGRVAARFVNGDGEAVGPTLTVAESPLGAFSPAVTWQGDRYLLAWVTGGFVTGATEIRAAYVSQPTSVSEPFTIVSDGRRHEKPSSATNGRSLVAWSGADQIRVYDDESRISRIVTSSVR
jgi:hypothetical protein